MQVEFWRPVTEKIPPKVLGDVITPPAPNEIEQDDQKDLIKRIGMVVVGLAVVIILIGLLIARGGFNPLYLGFLGMMVFTYVGLFGKRKGPNSKEQLNADRKAVCRGVGAAREKVYRHGLSMHTAMQFAYPDPMMLAGIVGTERMWHVQPQQPYFDFSALRYGIGEVGLGTQMVIPEAPPGEFLEPVSWVSVVRFLRHQSSLAGIPVALTTSRFPVIGFTGDRAAALGMLRSMLLEAAVTHGPDNMRIVLMTDEPDGPLWSWMKWLPHVGHPYGVDKLGRQRMMYDNWDTFTTCLDAEPDSTRRPVIDFTSQHTTDPEIASNSYRHVLVVVDSARPENLLDSTITGRAAVTWLLMNPPQGQGALTDSTGLVLRCDADGGVWRSEAHTPGVKPVKVAVADHVSVGYARMVARLLARYEPAGVDSTDHGATPVQLGRDWSTLMRVPDPGALDPTAMWSKITNFDDPRRLRVPIGFTRKFVARESPASLVRGWSASILFPGWPLPGVAAWPPLVGARHYRDWYECRGW